MVVWSAAELNGDGLADLLTQEGEPDATTTFCASGMATAEFADPGRSRSRADGGGGDRCGRQRRWQVDLVVRHPSRNTVAVQLGNGSGTFAAPLHFLLPHFIDLNGELEDLDDEFGWPFRPVVVADLNLDGRMDIAAGRWHDRRPGAAQRLQRPVIRSRLTIAESADPVAEGGAVATTP